MLGLYKLTSVHVVHDWWSREQIIYLFLAHFFSLMLSKKVGIDIFLVLICEWTGSHDRHWDFALFALQRLGWDRNHMNLGVGYIRHSDLLLLMALI